MEIQELQEIIALMKHSGVAELCLEEENFKLSLKREGSGTLPMVFPQVPVPQPLPSAPSAPEVAPNTVLIKSPMVGTFYAAPSPDSAPFVAEGSQISEESVVCILEAMKVMNEVRAECSGTILEVLVKNGAPVEYGQPLFKVQVR